MIIKLNSSVELLLAQGLNLHMLFYLRVHLKKKMDVFSGQTKDLVEVTSENMKKNLYKIPEKIVRQVET